MGHRDYDPGSGRFITRDPIGSGTNGYHCADNKPLSHRCQRMARTCPGI